MIEGILNNSNLETDEFKFVGSASLQVWGDGQLIILRSVASSPFLPLTDASGEPVAYSNSEAGGVIANFDISNPNPANKFKLRAAENSTINYIVHF